MGGLFIPKMNDTYSDDGWAPFNRKDDTSKLGEIDVAFLAVYSLGMYVVGHLGDTLDLRLFLTTGMIGSGIFVALFGIGYFWDVHHFWYFLGIQMVVGLFQATGWPSVVAMIGNWFVVLFLLPVFLITVGVVLYSSGSFYRGNRSHGDFVLGCLSIRCRLAGSKACFIPGVILFSLCFFFSKLVAYAFLFWFHFYLIQREIGGECLSVKSARNMSTLFDVEGIFGGILVGYIYDRLKNLWKHLKDHEDYPNDNCGPFINGPYARIIITVSTDLGTHSSLKGNSQALATVAVIIDGTISFEVDLYPLLTGFLSTKRIGCSIRDVNDRCLKKIGFSELLGLGSGKSERDQVVVDKLMNLEDEDLHVIVSTRSWVEIGGMVVCNHF
ncbi:unnamed protein product [Lactuca saligna]|uniref:Uncharacterized protein n=1 Tax=Lactuca saligna TaxID=75948 RepID=A0AA35ZVT6_LACSI|nr:unnamed protein product [Lactuca saligna]